MTELPKYTKNKMKGNIGEALAQYIFSKFCLVHKIDGSNDLGNDFICELIRDTYPTNLLFYVQVKYTSSQPRIEPETLEYWKGSPLPVYVFWIKDTDPERPFSPEGFEHSEKYYKRYTPILHGKNRENNEKFKPYEEVNFKRDLIVDYTRTQYVKGFTPVIEPRSFLKLDEKLQTDLPRYAFYIKDVIPEYEEQILNNSWSTLFTLAVLHFKKNTLHDLYLAEIFINLAIHQYEVASHIPDDSEISYELLRYQREIVQALQNR